MRPSYSLRAYLNFLFNDTKNYIESIKSERDMRTAEEIKEYNPKEFELDRKQPDNLETANFALGCFWSPDAFFGGLTGVIRTRVGYTGGDNENPTYRDLGNHTETIQIDYNPDKISFERLLEIFWKNHNPRSRQKTQYASKIFYNKEEQRQKAQRSLKNEDNNGEVVTEIKKLDTFWVAEDYHQKYYLRQNKELTKELEQVYNSEEYINSTVAARLNALISGKRKVNLDNLRLPENLMNLIESKEPKNTSKNKIC